MKKRIAALFCALLLLVSFSCTVSASIMVQEPNGDIHYSADVEEGETVKQPSAFSVAAKKVLQAVSGFWHRFGAVTVVVLLLVAIVVAIVISEFERQKKENRPPQSKSKKKKKKTS